MSDENKNEVRELTENEKRAVEIIKDYDYGIDIEICADNFFIIDSWNSLNKLVAVFNSVPIDYVRYGRVDLDRVLDPEKEFFGIGDILTEHGFSDEYSRCDCCYNSIRTSADSYSWVADYWIEDGEMICGDCIRDDEDLTERYINHLLNNPRYANTILDEKTLENLGFKKCKCNEQGEVCEFEAGWYGTWDDPKKILEKAIERNPDKDFIFEITSVGQFQVDYTMWNRNKEGYEEE